MRPCRFLRGARPLAAFIAAALLFVALTATTAVAVTATTAVGSPSATAYKASSRAKIAVAKKALRRCLKRARRSRSARTRANRRRACRRAYKKRARAARRPPKKSTKTPTTTSTAATSTNSFGSNIYGFSAGGTVLQYEDPTTFGRDLDTIQGAHARWLRFDINWAVIQGGGPSSYDWAPFDRVVQGAVARGINPLGVIAYTPSWARPSGTEDKYAPSADAYATFAAAAVRHYAAMGVHTYEVWNEPNIVDFWKPAPNPAAYTALLRAAYQAIKQADPSATVLTGGTAPAASDGTNVSPVAFLSGIYANGGGASFDAVAHHPYCWPAYPGDAQSWSAWYQAYGTSPSLRSTMVANGDSAKKIWATEFGAPTNGPTGSYVSEDTQAQMISRAYALWRTYDWAGPMFSYDGRDVGTDTSTRENFFGLLRTDFSQKPAYAAYQAAASSA